MPAACSVTFEHHPNAVSLYRFISPTAQYLPTSKGCVQFKLPGSSIRYPFVKRVLIVLERATDGRGRLVGGVKRRHQRQSGGIQAGGKVVEGLADMAFNEVPASVLARGQKCAGVLDPMQCAMPSVCGVVGACGVCAVVRHSR